MSAQWIDHFEAVASPQAGASPGNVFSLKLATVKSISDDKKLNRVKCLPINAEENEMTDWCYVMAPMGGKESGLFLPPQVGDLVVLGYLGNDPHSPIVLGSYWSPDSQAPITIEDGKAQDYCLKTPKKIDLALHDEDKKQKVTVTMPSGIVIEIDDEQQTVTTKNKEGNTALLMKMKDGEIELTAKNKLTLTAGNASVTLEKNGDVTIKGGGDVTLDGKAVSAKAQGEVSLQGMDVTLKASKDLNMSAGLAAALRGTPIKLN